MYGLIQQAAFSDARALLGRMLVSREGVRQVLNHICDWHPAGDSLIFVLDGQMHCAPLPSFKSNLMAPGQHDVHEMLIRVHPSTFCHPCQQELYL
jgi:hypothetical protein